MQSSTPDWRMGLFSVNTPGNVYSRRFSVNFKVGLSTSKKNYFIYFNEKPLQMMKNAFYFILKLFVLKIFKLLSWLFSHVEITGLEKLGFLVHESPCSSKQVQENVVRLVTLCTLWLYMIHVFALSCTSSCTKSNMER